MKGMKTVKNAVKKALCLLLSLALLLSSAFLCRKAHAEILEPNYYKVLSEVTVDMVKSGGTTVKPSEIILLNSNLKLLPEQESMNYGDEVILMPPESILTFDVNVEQAGGYHIMLDYFIPEASMRNLSIALTVNGEFQFYESRNIKLPAVWKDKTQEYDQDRYGNDIYPRPERVFKWQQAVLNNSIYSLSTPLVFNLKAGKNTITIENNQVEVMIGNISILPALKVPTYLEYKEMHKDKAVIKDAMQTIQGEAYTEKSESYIRGGKSNNYNLYPYDPGKKKINHLDANVWQEPGESVTYTFDVKEDGLYSIHFKYEQKDKKDFPVFKRIYIDGKIPFEEFNEYSFPFTRNSFRNETLKVNGEKVLLYLTRGNHTLTLESTASPYFETYENLIRVISMISDISLEIKKITGNKVDKNRDWNIEEYIPDIRQDLLESAYVLSSEYKKLSGIVGKENSSILSSLKVAVKRLQKYAEDPDDLVNNLDQFSQGSSSISQQIAYILPELLIQPMAIDCFYITGVDNEPPPPTVNFLSAFVEEIRKLVLSFLTKDENVQKIEKDKLNVWVNGSIPHIEVLREKTDSEFTKMTGIQVNISAMKDEQKLLLAVSAGSAPDVVLGASSYRPFDFALRGALYDLRQFEDFGQFIKDFPSEAFVPFVVDDGCYGIPETANFYVLYYRKDILEKLKLEVPETWEDTLKILPVLSRYGMNFNTLIANVGAMKHFGATVPFIQQFEGKIYSDDGSRVELDDPRTIEAFKLMTDLYTRYSLPESIANFYSNFRYGVTPIGMSDFNTYILLKNAAPEITEQWGIAPGIGVKNSEGKILRYQPVISTASIILKSSKMPEKGWEYIKWWMSTDTQVSYANDMQLRFGPEYIWNTANFKAFSQSTAFDEKDKKVILEQYAHIKEIPRNPAYFAVERELSNAWNKVVFSGMSPRTAIDQAIITSNREIAKKLKEFGYMDSQGNLIKPFEMATAEKIESWKE